MGGSEWPKSDLRQWQEVVYRPKAHDQGKEVRQSEVYVVRIGYAGRRTTFRWRHRLSGPAQ